MDCIKIKDKSFVPYIRNKEILRAVDSVAAQMNADFSGKDEVPVLLCVLNGSIIFMGHLLPRLRFPMEISSIKVSSYSGLQSTGEIRQILGIDRSIKDRCVVIIEDIVDTGNTIVALEKQLREAGARDVKICTFAFKPDSYDKDIPIDYIGIKIKNKFVVGWGFDYDQIGRNTEDIYILDENPDAEKQKYYVLFGPPGAGKGTQAKLLQERLGYYHISTGELLRKEIAAGTALGKEAAKLIEAGNLVPDEIVEGMIEHEFETNKGVPGFLLDGFPRTVAQAESLDKMLAERGEAVTRVVSIHISDDEIFRRIKGRALVENRADDANDEIIKNRLKNYREKTEPLIGYYRIQDKFFEINAKDKIEENYKLVSALLK